MKTRLSNNGPSIVTFGVYLEFTGTRPFKDLPVYFFGYTSSLYNSTNKLHQTVILTVFYSGLSNYSM